MAEVRMGLDVHLGRAVAIKQLLPELASDAGARDRLRQEARSAASLHHPGIVAVFDTGEEVDPRTGQPAPYIVMELVEGQTLGSLLRRGDRLAPLEALHVTQGLLAALAYSHRAGIVHQDIKPGNVMLTDSGVVKLLDFGIARTGTDACGAGSSPTTVLGTAKYLSPEQARGEVTDVRSDIYSAGCLMYELLVGRAPFVGGSVTTITEQHLEAAPVPPSQLESSVTPEHDAIVLKALAKAPEDRYQSADEMAAAVHSVSGPGHRVVAAVPTPAPAPAVASVVGEGAAAARVVVAGAPRRALGARPVESRRRPIATLGASRSRSRRRMALATSAFVAVMFPIGGLGLYNMSRAANEGQEASAQTVLGLPRTEADRRLPSSEATQLPATPESPDAAVEVLPEAELGEGVTAGVAAASPASGARAGATVGEGGSFRSSQARRSVTSATPYDVRTSPAADRDRTPSRIVAGSSPTSKPPVRPVAVARPRQVAKPAAPVSTPPRRPSASPAAKPVKPRAPRVQPRPAPAKPETRPSQTPSAKPVKRRPRVTAPHRPVTTAPTRTEKARKARRAAQPAKAAKREKATRPDRAARPDRGAKADKPGSRANRPSRPEKPAESRNRREKPAEREKDDDNKAEPDKATEPDKGDREKADKPGRGGKPKD